MTTPDLNAELTAAGVASASTRQLLAAAKRAGTATVVTGPDQDLTAAAAAILAQSGRHTAGSEVLDIIRATPTSDRWTVDDVDTRIVHVARLKAIERTDLIIEMADAMPPKVADHLLKTIEEPAAGTHFWLCTTHPDRLPATIRGRATTTLAITAADASETVARLVAAGMTTGRAEAVVDLAGGNSTLAKKLAERPELLPHMQAVLDVSYTADPVQTWPGMLASMAAVTVKTGGKVAGETTWSKLTPVQKAEIRALARTVIDRWTRQARDEVATTDSNVKMCSLDLTLRALADATAQLNRGTSVPLVIPAALANCRAAR